MLERNGYAAEVRSAEREIPQRLLSQAVTPPGYILKRTLADIERRASTAL